MLTIRNATITDIPLIRGLTMQVWPQTYTPIIGKEQVAYMLDRFYTPESLAAQMEEQRHTFIIGYLDNSPVAFAAYSQIAPGVFKLHKLYIITGCQGKGVGRQMVDHIGGAIKTAGATELQLNVNIHNSPALIFYKKAGFTRLRDEDIDIGSGYFMNDHVLRLNIQ